MIIAYVKADGTLTINESEAEPLDGTEIPGLTNGKLYKVEEYSLNEPEEPEEPEEPTPTPDPEEEEPGQDDQQPEEPGQDQENPQPTPEPEEEPEPEPEEDDQQPDLTPTPTPDPEPDPEPDPTPTPRPSSNSGSSHSHNSNNAKPVVKVETKPAVTLSYNKAVLDTTKTEYLLGYTDGLLGNKDTVTRAQLVQIVYRLLTPESKAAVYSVKNSFKDVAFNAWYNEAVSSIANAGLIAGGTGAKFNPDENITWGEMVSIFAKFAKPNSEWKIITRHWARDALNTAISYRWFEYNDQFNPDGEVTRLEMLKFINTIFDWTSK